MAAQGRVYLFGDGQLSATPIHGLDLAQEIVKQIDSDNQELNIGGPDTLTQNQIAEMAFEAAGKPIKITHISDWIRRTLLKLLPYVMPRKSFGPIQFFMTIMAIDMSAPEYGHHTLKAYFQSLKNNLGHLLDLE